MGVETQPDVYMLMKDGQGWLNKEHDSHHGAEPPRRRVPRGSLAQLHDHHKEVKQQTSIQVCILDQKDVRMVPLVSELKLVGRRGDQTYQLLRGVSDPEFRYHIIIGGGLKDLCSVRTGSSVLYSSPGREEDLPAIVRFLGQGPGRDNHYGWKVGLEIKKKGWELGETNGVVDNRKYFEKICQETKGVFCDMSRVKLCQNHCDTFILPSQSIPISIQSRTSIQKSNKSGTSIQKYNQSDNNIPMKSTLSGTSIQKYNQSDNDIPVKSNQTDSSIPMNYSQSQSKQRIPYSQTEQRNSDNQLEKNNLSRNNNMFAKNRNDDNTFLKKFKDVKHQDTGSESDPAPPPRAGRRKPSGDSMGRGADSSVRGGDIGRGRGGRREPPRAETFSWNPNKSDKPRSNRGRKTPELYSQGRKTPELYSQGRKTPDLYSQGRKTPEHPGIIPELYPAAVFKTAPRSLLSRSSDPLNRNGSGSYEELDYGHETSSRLDGTNSRLDGTNSRLDGTNSRLDGTNSRLDGTNSRLDGLGGWSGTPSRLDSSEISLDFIDPQESDDLWSSDQQVPARSRNDNQVPKGSRNPPARAYSEDLAFPWTEQLSQSHPQQPPNPWNREQLRREEQLRWDQKQLERDQKQLEQLRREKEQLRREEQLQRDQEQLGGGDVWGGERLLRSKDENKTWGEILGRSSPVDSNSSSPKDNREEVKEAARFDQLVSEAGEEVVGSMVQLEQAGQPVFGVVRWRGSIESRDWVGIELEDEVPGGGAGQYKGRSLFSCPLGKGVFVPATHIRPDPRFSESLKGAIQDFGSMDCPVLPGVFSPHAAVAEVEKVAGRNRGIQGHQNSCYLDATLFSMFTFSSAFDSLLYRPRDNKDIPQYEEVQRVLRDDIVNPLRQTLFVRADRVLALRTLLDNLSSVSGLLDQEKDPEEFLNSLLKEVLRATPYLELSSGQSSHTYQLFVEKDPHLIVPTLQELFDQSFLSSRVKLRRAPPVLILQMPRFGRQFKMYERVIPTQLLDITDVITGIPRECVICGQLAAWECAECYNDQEKGLLSTAFCDNKCFGQIHQHQRRKLHQPVRLDRPAGVSVDVKVPRICMELVAVVCIETSHYVSFVRCGDSVRSPWAFFDSMADRKGEQNGYNIPELSPAPEVEFILSEEGGNTLREDPTFHLSPQAKRLVSDSYICFYQSQEVQMYN